MEVNLLFTRDMMAKATGSLWLDNEVNNDKDNNL